MVNNSRASIAKAKISAAFDSVTNELSTWVSSGASKPSIAPGVAATVSLGLRCMGPSPYSAKQALPDPSMWILP